MTYYKAFQRCPRGLFSASAPANHHKEMEDSWFLHEGIPYDLTGSGEPGYYACKTIDECVSWILFFQAHNETGACEIHEVTGDCVEILDASHEVRLMTMTIGIRV